MSFLIGWVWNVKLRSVGHLEEKAKWTYGTGRYNVIEGIGDHL